jgi:type I restriction enzyme R subunit
VNDPRTSWPRSRPTTRRRTRGATTDPNLVFNLRAKLDAAGHYDDFEVDRVVKVELEARCQAKRADRRAGAGAGPPDETLQGGAGSCWRRRRRRTTATKAAQDELNALILFKGDMGAFIRLYTFLSQIFDYGNTAIEKRAIF